MEKNSRRTRIGRIAKLTAVAVCLAVPLSGGWCQRYKDDKERTARMRHYYDSVLRAERLYKDSLSHARRKDSVRTPESEDARK